MTVARNADEGILQYGVAQSDRVKRADFIYFDAGGGHRAAATALRDVMERQNRPFAIRMVNLQEILDEIDVYKKITGVRLQDLYNLMLKKGWTFGSAQWMALMHGMIKLFHPKAVGVLRRFWAQDRPDLLVSLVPNLNRALREALTGVPMVTILTDLADYPPHFWMEQQDQHVICGTDKAVRQAAEVGFPAEKVHRVSGMILNPRFYDLEPLTAEQRAAERSRLGFDSAKPVGLVLFGGEGSAVMIDIARRLHDRQLLLICGKNARLADKLRALRRTGATFVEGFTKEVPRYMQLADYFIGKPGPGSISEAIAMRLPVIVSCNSWTLPQERYNADWIREQGVGVVLPNFRDIDRAVDQMLDPQAYERFCAATTRLQNRAVFEIPDILEGITRTGEISRSFV
jgi:UDP-N-acetylglucosamine:LPS N-acetylglucosamine transferase